jgi:TetR/AcrR family transcriptional regulator, mexCD-oprJ operon repressor
MASDTTRQDRPGREAPGAGTSRPGAIRRRADAERNIAAILDAGLACFSRSADASVAEVAQAAGVGRVTLYGHFPSREALIDAVLAYAITKANTALDAVAIDHGPAAEALARLIGSSWRIIDQHRRLLAAAQAHLPPARVRHHHDQAMARLERLIARGQDQAEFRTDLPRSWLVATFYSLMHGAAEEVDADRLDPDQAGGVLTATLQAAFATPATPRPARPRASSDTTSSSR